MQKVNRKIAPHYSQSPIHCKILSRIFITSQKIYNADQNNRYFNKKEKPRYTLSTHTEERQFNHDQKWQLRTPKESIPINSIEPQHHSMGRGTTPGDIIESDHHCRALSNVAVVRRH